MSNHQYRDPLPDSDLEAEMPRPIEQLHPMLLSVVNRMEVMPPGDKASISHTELAHAVSLAISMLSDNEQAYIISRIMTDDEVAEERLQSPQIQDLRRRIRLSGDEIRLLLRGSPEPEDDGEEGEVEDGCIVCLSQSEVSVPCGCHYCCHCLRESIRISLRSEVDFPPGCCRPFDEATIRLAERPALVHLFRQRSAEYAIPAAERLYCHDPGCSSSIPPTAIQPAALDEDNATPVGTCLSCHRATCAACGGRSHRGLPCREEDDEGALWNMMDDQGLVGCPECGIVIALREGCNHMTCVCTAEFCYLCGREWGECPCPGYNGFHLRVPVRLRPGRRPIGRSGRAHLAGGTEGMPRIPQLRYDPEDEVALAAVDYAPVVAPAPAAAPNLAPSPAPNREEEQIVRPNNNPVEYIEIPLNQDVLRPPQHRHRVPIIRPHLLNGGPIGRPPFPPRSLPLSIDRHAPPYLDEQDEPPPPIPSTFLGAYRPLFRPFDRPIFHHNPAPDNPPDRTFNNRVREANPFHRMAPDEIEQAIQQLRIGEAMLRDQLRRRAATIEAAREVFQALEPNAVRQRVPQVVREREPHLIREHGDPDYRVHEHGQRGRERRGSR